MNTSVRTVVMLGVLAVLARAFVAAQDPSSEAELLKTARVKRSVIDIEEALREKKAVDIAELVLVRPSQPGIQTLVIPSSGDIEAEVLATTVEDLSVMARILDKTLERELGAIDPFPGGYGRYGGLGSAIGRGRSGVQGIYLQGYGALFQTNVKFPLAAPPAKEEEKTTVEAETVWVQTKGEMYGPWPELLPSARSEIQYDAEKVEKLKKVILETLKHAANMRNVKPTESIAVAVLGGETIGPVVTTRTTITGPMFPGGPGVGGVGGRMPTTRGPAGAVGTGRPPTPAKPRPALGGLRQETVLTIHVKKADVDAFAEGKLTFDQFREKATIFAY